MFSAITVYFSVLRKHRGLGEKKSDFCSNTTVRVETMLLSLMLMLCCALQAQSLHPCDGDDYAAFLGGYLSVEWDRSDPNSNSFKKINFKFKPTYEFGVLFFIEFQTGMASENNNSSNIVSMLSYNHSSLIFSIHKPRKQPALSNSLVSKKVSLTSNNTLQLHIRNNVLRIKLKSKNWYTYSFNSRVNVKSLLFGGAKDFTAYHQFPVRTYFVGVLSYFNVGSDCINVVERNALSGNQAILQDHCTATVPPFIDLNGFSLPLATTVTVQPTNRLRVNFTIATRQCVGEIFHLTGGSFTIGLSASKLITTITNSSGHSANCRSNSVISQSGWINVMITYINDTLKYVIDDEENGNCHLDLGSVNFTGTLIIGASKNTSVSFVGHLRHLYWDDSEINLLGLATAEQQSCVGVGPVGCNSTGFNATYSPSCPTCVLPDLPIYWAAFDVSVKSNLTVTERRQRTITSSDFNLSYAGSQCLSGSDLHKLHRKIIFTLQEPYPAHGTINNEFTFEDVEKNRVHYDHSGTEEESDVVNLLVQVHCDSTLLYKKSVKICIHVSSTNDNPKPQLNDIYVVVGTRYHITQDVILMFDQDTSLELVHCTKSEVRNKDGSTGQFEWADRPGHKITDPFYQRDIDAGRIIFRLFLNGTGTSTAALTISDGIAENYGSFKVYGTNGIIRLMKNKSVTVVENRNASINKFHLFADTNFEDQNPIVTFTLTSFPNFGELLLVYNQSFIKRNVSRFTQHDVDSRKLFYSHTVYTENSTKDCFSFKLMVDDFNGGNGTCCVSILIEDHLPKLVLNMSIAQSITLPEGGKKIISDDDLVITSGLDTGEITPLPDDVIILLLITELPKYGTLYLNKTVVVGGSNISLDQLKAGLLVYDHEVDEQHQDSFNVTIIAQNFSHLLIQSQPVSSIEYVVNIDIAPINNKYPQIQIYANLIVKEGYHTNLTTNIINITDADRPADNLTVYVTPKVAFNGYFASWQNYSVAISKFSVDDIVNGQVVFVHPLGNELEADYVFVVSDGLHNSSHDFKVVAKPVKLSVSTTHSTEHCSLHLDLLNSINSTSNSNAVQIHNGLFNIEIDSGDLPNVLVTTAADNCVYLKNNSEYIPVEKFFKRDIDNGRIWCVIKDNKTRISERMFGLNFSIGHAEPVHVQFRVCLGLLPYPELVAASMILSLPEHGDIAVTSAVLSSNDTRNQTSLYDVIYELVAPPTNGQLLMESYGPIIKFSQSDIDGHKIHYRNHNYSSSGDEFILSISNQFYEHTENVTITINIYLLRLDVVNNGFKATEGGEHVIARNELYAMGPPGYSVMFHVMTLPAHGEIILSTNREEKVSRFSKGQLDSGVVVYVNHNEEYYNDSMIISIKAIHDVDTPSHIPANISQANNTAYFGTVDITIDLINDNPPRLWNKTRVEVVDGQSVIITSLNFSFLDDDIDMNISLLRYTVKRRLLHGYLFFRSKNNVTYQFLQQNIYDLEIGYQNNKNIPFADTDLCVLEVFDGKYTTTEILEIKILPFTVESVNNESLVLDEGSEMVLSDKNILFEAPRADPQANDSEYIYTINKHPTHGRLIVPNSCNCSFTQEELRNGSVIYKHDDSDTTRDSFTFMVTVRGYPTPTPVKTFIIIINSIDDESPSVTYKDKLLVHFGTRVYFDATNLNATDSEAEPSNLVYNVIKAPVFGSIKHGKTGSGQKTFSFTQHKVNEETILYQHEREPNGEWVDNVTLSLDDGKNSLGYHIFITFILIPDILPITVKGITLSEGAIVPLTAQNFEVTHPYLSMLELYINVTEPVTYGKLLSLSFYQAYTMYFNSTELKNGSIIYFNQEDYEVTKETFKFVAMAGGVRSTEHTFVFTITSVNDEIPVIIRNSVISVWAGEIKLISKDDLCANDSDAHPADKLEYIIDTNTPLGYFAYKEAHDTNITRFWQDDIVASNVVFKSNPIVSDTELEINFIVTDGKHNVESYITFEINVLTVTVDAPHIVVAMGANQLLRFSAQTNDDDDSVKRQIYYQVLDPPALGSIKNTASGLVVTNFTQEEINNQQIVYQHTAMDRYETSDLVNFTVSTELAMPVQTLLFVSVTLKKSSNSHLAASESLNVDEGGTVCLNESILDASNVLYEVWKSNQSVGLHNLTIQYAIVSLPSSGELKHGNVSVDKYFEHDDLKSPPGVCYHHNDLETTNDNFSVIINILYNSDIWYSNATVITIPIYIKPLNDERPVLTKFVKKMFVFKYYNYTAIIQPEELCVVDEDTADEDLVYVIVSHNQSMVNCSLYDVPTHNFTQSDINKGRVKCKLPYSVSTSNLTFYFTDGNFTSEKYTMQYSKIILTLSIAHNTLELRYSQNKGLTGVTLTNEYLNSSTTGSREDTVYQVTSLPNYGDLIKVNHGAVSNFTQVDIDDGMIQYTASDRDMYEDIFTMEVTNRHAMPQKVTIHIVAMAMIGINNEPSSIILSSINDTQPLPADLFNITALVNVSNSDPLFTVINELIYGHLDLHTRKKSSNDQLFSFSGSQLTENKVLYVLNENITNGTEVIKLLVRADNMQAGFAEVSISISVLPTTTLTPTSSPTTRPLESNPSSSYSRRSGFTLFALVPIIGVPTFILIVVLILVGFWYLQKLKEKKRCAAARGSSAICMGSPQFNLPTGYNTVIATDIDHSSERQSDHSSNNSDEGISMAMPADDHVEDEGVAQKYTDDHFQLRPVMDHTHYQQHQHHPLTSLYTSSGHNSVNPQHVHLQKLPILKNEEYWL